MTGETTHEQAHLFCLELFSRPGPQALELESVFVHAVGHTSELCGRVGERGRRRVHPDGDLVLLLDELYRQSPPGFRILLRVLPDATNGVVERTMHGDNAPVRENVRIIDFRPNQIKAVCRQVQLLWNGGEIGELIPKSMQVRLEARQSYLFGGRHATHRVVLIECQHFQSGLRQITRRR